MNLYFAPMEGITSYTYRNAHYELFGGCDEYFAPFIVSTDNERLSMKTLRDIKDENNIIRPSAQVMCTAGTAFCAFVNKVKPLGFDKVNLNLGCPSGTVVKKQRGSGALKDTKALDEFLDYIFTNADIDITVKTRAGFYSHDEFPAIFEVFSKYPIKELIIHPRVREEYYKGVPNMATYDYAYEHKCHNICYNGNIFSKSDFEKIANKYPLTNSVMIGRGAVRNPAIFREIKGGKSLQTEELIKFSNVLEERYLRLLQSEKYTLHRLKEIWLCAITNYPNELKIAKAIKKSNKLSEINSAINCLPEL